MEGKRSGRARRPPNSWGASGKGSRGIPPKKKPRVSKKKRARSVSPTVSSDNDCELVVPVEGPVSAVPGTAAPSTPVPNTHAPLLPVVNTPDPPPAPRAASHKNIVGDEFDELNKSGAGSLPSDDDGEHQPYLNDSDGESCPNAAFGEGGLVLEEALGMTPGLAAPAATATATAACLNPMQTDIGKAVVLTDAALLELTSGKSIARQLEMRGLSKGTCHACASTAAPPPTTITTTAMPTYEIEKEVQKKAGNI
jgi:hypothetical protein